ncbi:hypothetical protein EII34_12810 [Arachnia propionica]|uniref:Uncharacterized protein n=1 Tax=Arachnia propionica TaxID=1750 RepID=A0A3P1T4E8_9ACTN|nr:hypothetical protein [Arachnia propionica]RRD03686.1 hypothetical protein EII34_12810 [Arachnia propionica]
MTTPTPAVPVKEIATLPPLPRANGHLRLSQRTGEPTRPWTVTVALVVMCLAAAVIAVFYGRHWWLAVHPPEYPTSALLVEWIAPDPGKWLSLTLEGVLALIAFLAAGACGWAGFQGWNGWAFSRWAGLSAIVATGVAAATFSPLALVAVGLATLSTVLLFLPVTARFFRDFAEHRHVPVTGWRRPEQIFYGRLPRFR